MLNILKSTYTSILILVLLLLFLFKGIFVTYAYTDGYEFIWDSTGADFINSFLQQGRVISGWINTLVYPQMDHVSDLWRIRGINLMCLFLSSVLIFKMLKQNNINKFHALVITIIFICSPFASIVVHWEATSSTIWGYPVALFAGDIVFTAFLNKNNISKKWFNLILYTGILLALISLFIYQPAYTAFIFPAFLHFITGKKRDAIKQFLLLHVFIYVIYFLLYKFQLNQLHIPPDARAGIMISFKKIAVFIKGVFLRSLHYNVIFASVVTRVIIITVSLLFIGYFIYSKIKNETKNNKWNFVLILAAFFILAYLPNFISSDSFIAYRTMGTILLLSSFLFISSIASMPVKPEYINVAISVIVIAIITVAYFNNKTFVDIQSKEYLAVKNIMAEKLKRGYPKKIAVIMADEKFLEKQNLVPNIVTDEFGKLSNTVYWVPKPFVLLGIYDLTNDKPRTKTIEVTYFKRNEFSTDSLMRQNDWVLDIEKIYLSSNGIQP